MKHYSDERPMRHLTSFLTLAILLLTASAAAKQYEVKSTADAGTHSLRWAIVQANASPGRDVITFAIPGNGPHTIAPASPLPPLNDPAGVILDGLSQPGSSVGDKPPSTLEIRILIDGARAGSGPGLWLLSSNNLVQGLSVTGFAEDGIRIQGTAEGTTANTVRYCVIGLDPTGIEVRANGTETKTGRWAGLSLISMPHAPGDVHDNTVEGNVIAGNAGDGIILADCPGGNVYRNTISGNFIGVTLSGDVARGNGRDGILLFGGSYANTVTGNVIAGNQSDGVHLVGDMERSQFAHENVITRNRIGVSPQNRLIGNAINGVNIGGREYESPGGFASRNSILSNIIAGNGRNGVVVWEHSSTKNNADQNRISQNSMFANGRFPIDLGDDGISLNDPTDQDSGPNEMLNTPVILTAEFIRGVSTVRGTVTVVGDPTQLSVELYKQHRGTATDISGSLYLGRVAPDGGGNWVYSSTGSLLPGDSVLALVIDDANNTSEYAREKPITEGSEAIAEEQSPHLLTRGVGLSASAMIAETQIDGPNGGVRFTLNVERACWGILEIFTSRGELVTTLVNRWLPAGEYAIEWDGRNWKGDRVPGGSYLCRFDADGIRQNTSVAL